MSDEPFLQRLLATVYASAIDAEERDQLPDMISRWTGGTTAALWVTDRERAPVEVPVTNGPAEGASLYARHFHLHDPWASQFFAHNSGEVVRGSRTIADAELDRSVFYNEFGREFGLFHQINTTFAVGDGRGLRFSTLSVLRDKPSEGFSDAEVGRLQVLVPHLKQAMRLRGLVDQTISASREATLVGLVEGLRAAACIVDGDCRIVHANESAESLHRSRPRALFRGTSIERSFGIGSRRQLRRLLDAVADAASGLPGGIMLLSGEAGFDLHVQVSPLPFRGTHPIASPRGLALVVLRPVGSPDHHGLVRACVSLYDMTKAEAEVTALLVAGASLQGIAADRGSQISTVRTLLARAQSKSGSSNLRQLVARLAPLG